jgi:hypothetical protein
MSEQAGTAGGGRGWGIVRKAIVLAPLFCALSAGAGQIDPGARGGVQTAPTRPSFGNDPLGPPDPAMTPNPRKLEHLREDERRKRLQADTAKLVELTNELKNEVDKANKDELSLDVVRKAAEIEKLAHDVKERMKS